jgi:4-aminobutyrate aminotransferase/(S)-3-amino-2-methylpropionate transaminase
MKKLCVEYPHLVDSGRMLGTLGSINAVDTKLRDDIIVKLRNKGVHTGASGVRSIRLRPSLTFNQHHADIYLNCLEDVLKTF